MASQQRVLRAANDAMESNKLVAVSRTPEYATTSRGFVVGIGTKWMLLRMIDEAGAPEGYLAVRIDDVAHIRADKSFAGRAAAELDDWPPTPPSADYDLASTRGLLKSFANVSANELIGIEKERERYAQWIGVFEEIIGKYVYLHEVRPSGKWYKRPLGYKIGAITSIGIGGLYRTALARYVDWSARPAPPE